MRELYAQHTAPFTPHPTDPEKPRLLLERSSGRSGLRERTNVASTHTRTHSLHILVVITYVVTIVNYLLHCVLRNAFPTVRLS